MKYKLLRLYGQEFVIEIRTSPEKLGVEFEVRESCSNNFLSAYIKWDGCSHLDFAESIHCCDLNYVQNMNDLVKELYRIAAKEMGDNWKGWTIEDDN